MIKDVRKHLNKSLCGLVLESKYIKKTWRWDWDDSEAKALGRYFEYILSDGKAVNRDGSIPQPLYMASALKKRDKDPNYHFTVEDMYAEYRLAHKNCDRVKLLFGQMKVEILEIQVKLQKVIDTESGQVHMEGTIDIIAMYQGQRIIIDVKYSGLIYDKWNELGWMMTPEQIEYNGFQVKQYDILASGIPFFFLVVSSTNDTDLKWIEMRVEDYDRSQHLIDVKHTRGKLLAWAEYGFTPYPELKRCNECPLRENCASRALVPQTEIVYLSSQD